MSKGAAPTAAPGSAADPQSAPCSVLRHALAEDDGIGEAPRRGEKPDHRLQTLPPLQPPGWWEGAARLEISWSAGAWVGFFPSLEIFKTHLDVVLCSLLQVTLLQQEGWTR